LRIVEKIVKIEKQESKEMHDGFAYLHELIESTSAKCTLAINPRSGQLLQKLTQRNSIVDSFVSDNEWIDIAKTFSGNVFAGYSHKPLLQIVDAVYDMVLICEDIGFVDDCDAMLKEYYRLLKPGGFLLGGLWNIRYADYIDAFLRNKAVQEKSELCGNSLIPIDGLIARLGELGFKSTQIYNQQSDREDSETYAEVSNQNLEPVSTEVFNTKIHFIKAAK
jgi:SAM-dependent methyltransferase